MSPEYYYLLAISNRNFSINQIQPPFSKGRRLNTIPAEQLGAITKRFPKDIIQSDTKVIYIPKENSVFHNDIIEKDAVAFAFALNFYVDEPGVIIDRAYTFKKIRVLKCLNIHYVNGVTVPPGSTETRIRLRRSAKPVDIESLCDQTRNALDKDKNMILTINKYNSACARQNSEERIIELSICMESLFSGHNEIAFRFALFNTLFTKTEAHKRHDQFKLLKTLYNARSAIIHGGDPQKYFPKIRDQWPDLIKICQLSLIYKIQFLKDNDRAAWDDHLERLALGATATENES